ncbi:MAG: dihydrofolate reductase family protein [Actinomycetales bacterium]
MPNPNPTRGAKRRVVANITLSLDGRTHGAAGDADMSWIVPHAVTDTARDHMTAFTRTASTALLGRKNFEGFGGFWPAVADMAEADPRDRAFSAWLNEADKVVLSTSLQSTDWAHSRIERHDPVTVVDRLQAEAGGDIVVLASGSVIRALLAADRVDRLSLVLCPQVAGGGTRLFEDGLPATAWRLVSSTPTESGALCLIYDRSV